MAVQLPETSPEYHTAPHAVLRGYCDADSGSSAASSEDGMPLLDFKGHDKENSHLEAQRMPLRIPKRVNLKAPLLTVILIVLVLGAFHTGHKHGITQNTYQGRDLLPLTMDHVFNGTFSPDFGPGIAWLAEAGDGVYSTRTDSHGIELHDLANDETRMLVQGTDVLDRNGIQLWWDAFQLSADGQYILFKSRVTQRWRYSSRADYYIHDLTSGTTKPLTGVFEPPRTALARWAPHGHALAYVHSEDLYVLPSPADSANAIRVTSSRNLTIPWVIEEEVLASDSAMWWSPDSTRLAFLSFDESKVPSYKIPIFNPDPERAATKAYPNTLSIPYPKAGSPNPTTMAHVYSVASDALVTLDLDIAFAADNRLVNEVAFITPTDLIVKLTDRYGKHLKVVHYDLSVEGTSSARVTRDVNYAEVDGGWVETGRTIVPVPGVVPAVVDVSRLPTGYLDIVPNEQGLRSIAMFSPADSSDPIFMTSGTWEVVSIDLLDIERRLIYFTAADPSVDRRIRSRTIPYIDKLEELRATAGGERVFQELTKESGYYRASFSPGGGFYALGYTGPSLPWSRILKVGDASFRIDLATNADLAETLGLYDMPAQSVREETVGDQTFNVFEMLPPRFDRSGKTKYPVLFKCYGGPSSQIVNSQFNYDWMAYLASTLGYIIVMVDGRGTGFKGRSFRAPVSGFLGGKEAIDQVAVASAYAKRPFVDETKIGIWGWSYGGYLTGRVIERNSGVFSLGMSVAPVTDWRFYDTVYSERYLSGPRAHRDAYDRAAIRDMEGFKRAAYFLAHGSGDDNVHIQNSMDLLDRLTIAQVRGFRFRLFVDSAHSMLVRGAYRELHEEMTTFLIEHWGEAKTKYRTKSLPQSSWIGDG